ncbi:unnamed protein product [Timema podura]|uniref:Uncharacterized protein n=1 Tax=Timema podura TaxID=61482 RepID=A0ABN7P2E4_TIMPD|nr:unnamed protein product [Timema podura]
MRVHPRCGVSCHLQPSPSCGRERSCGVEHWL